MTQYLVCTVYTQCDTGGSQVAMDGIAKYRYGTTIPIHRAWSRLGLDISSIIYKLYLPHHQSSTIILLFIDDVAEAVLRETLSSGVSYIPAYETYKSCD